jgi:hypothetical protein
MRRMAKLPRLNKALSSDWFSAALQTSPKRGVWQNMRSSALGCSPNFMEVPTAAFRKDPPSTFFCVRDESLSRRVNGRLEGVTLRRPLQPKR